MKESSRPRFVDAVQQGLRLDRAIRLVWTSAPGWATLNLLLVVVQGLLPLAGLYLMKRLIDALQAGIAASGGSASFRPVLVWVVLAAGVALLTALARSLADVAGQAQSLVLTDKVTDVLHSQSVAVDLEYYENPLYHDTLQRAQGDAAQRPVSIVNRLVQIGQSAISLAGIGGLLFAFNPLLALVLALVALPGALVRLVYSRRLYRFEQEQTKQERRAWYYHWMLTHSYFAKEVRLFDLGSLFRTRFRALRQQLRGGRLALTRRRTLAGVLAQSVATVAVFGALAYIAYQTFKGTVTIGSLVMYYSAFQLATGSVSAILGGFAGLYEDNLFLSNFYKFLDLKPRVTAPVKPLPCPSRIDKGIAFNDVGFTYPGTSRKVLEGVNLTVAPGQVIALVGENGSGKTTLAKLLCRLYDPDSGAVTVDGVDIRQFEPARWRRQVSVVLQDYVQYQLPVWENIWLGDAESVPDRERIVEAARRSGVDPVIRRLPQGYDTPLGCWFEHGHELSVGEWQKVALARAFLRDSQIVVLDEPTSSLDPLAEEELFRHFRQAIHGRGAVLISHRFSTVQMADHIYVLDKGRVVEQGTHRQLLETDGLYARLYLAQAAPYHRS
ncbi:ABC transporter ATP-binding protein [candidate division WOR-3 bacterium]|uniref:ABC transporter ATP-binding protein n=1 Tax=candidate division WOR-3 bacterium TaxID=2052148 RepID=A0A937XIM1_UNCW3|nr:ABC transporter ATP-binding protein [candidate division WOR-3 bacterium]